MEFWLSRAGFLFWAMLLKLINDFGTMLIGAEGRDTRKCLRILFVRCLFEDADSVSGGKSGSKGDPADAGGEERRTAAVR